MVVFVFDAMVWTVTGVDITAADFAGALETADVILFFSLQNKAFLSSSE